MPKILSLCDYTGNMVRPWADAGYECLCVDLKHSTTSTSGNITFIGADLLEWVPPLQDYWMVFAFPPCTDLAVSGALHFKRKGLSRLVNALDIVNRCRLVCEASGSRWMLENPVSTISTYWRKPDHTFDPYQYAAYPNGENDTYTKKTCLWTGPDFVMPTPKPISPDPNAYNHILSFSPSPERASLRSTTPPGFAQAVYEANHA